MWFIIFYEAKSGDLSLSRLIHICPNSIFPPGSSQHATRRNIWSAGPVSHMGNTAADRGDPVSCPAMEATTQQCGQVTLYLLTSFFSCSENLLHDSSLNRWWTWVTNVLGAVESARARPAATAHHRHKQSLWLGKEFLICSTL